MNRLTKEQAAKDGNTVVKGEYGYSAYGFLSSEKNGNTENRYGYSPNLGKLISFSSKIDGKECELIFDYDSFGNMIYSTFSSQENFRNKEHYADKRTYDTEGRLLTVSERYNATGSYNKIADYTYDSVGNVVKADFGNGTSTEYSYDKGNQITSLINKIGSDVISSYAYTYLYDGNVASKTENTGKVTSYTYDGLNRLKKESVTGNGNNLNYAYTYDVAVGVAVHYGVNYFKEHTKNAHKSNEGKHQKGKAIRQRAREEKKVAKSVYREKTKENNVEFEPNTSVFYKVKRLIEEDVICTIKRNCVEEILEAVVLDFGTELALFSEFNNLCFDGFKVIRKKDIKEIEYGEVERQLSKIIKAERIVPSICGVGNKDLDGFKVLFERLKEEYIGVIVECDNDESFYIGKILDIDDDGIEMTDYDTDGTYNGEIWIDYEDISTVSFGNRYTETFLKYAE